MRKFLAFFIILLFPLLVAGHGEETEFPVKAIALPGQSGYFLQQVGEWLEVNIFTLGTKQKQEKRLGLARRRLAEIIALAQSEQSDPKNVLLAERGYEAQMSSATDMAEKIIFLDGVELPLAKKIETDSRLHEQILAVLLGRADRKFIPSLSAALDVARSTNKEIFHFMVNYYQFTDADIQTYREIVGQHDALVREGEGRISIASAPQKLLQIQKFLDEAEEFEKAGLNIAGYDRIASAKNLLYFLLAKSR